MTYEARFPTRHTDAFGGTPYVHGGVLIALTEMAYAGFERHCGVRKPDHVVAVQRETRAVYRRPLPWRHGALIRVTTTEATEAGFTQEFEIRSAQDGTPVATVIHQWVWLDTAAGRPVPLPPDVQERFLAGEAPAGSA